MKRFLTCLAVCALTLSGFASVAMAHDDCPTPTPAELQALRAKKICEANAAYDAAVARADADFRAAVRTSARAKRATLKEKLAALRAARCTRSCVVEAAAKARRAAYTETDALAPPREPQSHEEHYLAVLHAVGPKIEAEYRSNTYSAYAAYRTHKSDQRHEIELRAAQQLRTARYAALRRFYFDHRPQNRW